MCCSDCSSQTYPAQSPSAEFIPEFQFSGGANTRGKKGGTNVCLSIFSDFAKYHPEWANEKGTGWSTYVLLVCL